MMRKSINIILAASLLMSCSASNDAPDTLADGSHAVKLNMRVGVSAGVVTGSRELDTWDGAQQVNDMRIYVFRCPEDKKGTSEEAYTYCIPIETEAAKNGYYSVDAFNNREPYYSAEHQNMPEQHLYTIEPYLENGYYYQFLAIGRDDKYATTTFLKNLLNLLLKTKRNWRTQESPSPSRQKTAPNSVSSIPQSCLAAFCKTRIPERKPPYS